MVVVPLQLPRRGCSHAIYHGPNLLRYCPASSNQRVNKCHRQTLFMGCVTEITYFYTNVYLYLSTMSSTILSAMLALIYHKDQQRQVDGQNTDRHRDRPRWVTLSGVGLHGMRHPSLGESWYPVENLVLSSIPVSNSSLYLDTTNIWSQQDWYI